MIVLRKNSIVFLFAFAIFSCGGNGNEPSTEDNGKDRKEILTHWVDNIIVPSYENFRSDFDVMADAGETFINTPNATNLSTLRDAWVDAYESWQTVELFEFGPADRYTLRNFFNIYPADVTGIAASIQDPTINLDVPSAYSRQGFPALDYLLNGVAENDEAILAYYLDTEHGSKRLAFLERIIERMNSMLTNVISEWNGSYRDTFISKTGLDIGSSMGLVVNAYVLHFERFIRSGKIGIPSGASVASAGVPHPEKVEAYHKNDISLALAQHAQQAVEDFFVGKNKLTGETGPSFKTYLDALNAKDASSGTLLSEIITGQMDAIEAKLDGLSPSLLAQIENDNQKMIDVHTEMQNLVRMLKVDMTSAMSITITYTDNDGD